MIRADELIDVSKLRPSSWNANRVPPKMLQKIRRSMTEFGFVENLVARPHPDEEGAYEVLSGNHRLQLLQQLGVEKARVVVVELDDAHARLLSQALNRTRGRDDRKAWRALLDQMLESLSAEEISSFLPEDVSSIKEGSEEMPAVEPDPVWGVIVTCRDEPDQLEVLQRMIDEGKECRALMT